MKSLFDLLGDDLWSFKILFTTNWNHPCYHWMFDTYLEREENKTKLVTSLLKYPWTSTFYIFPSSRTKLKISLNSIFHLLSQKLIKIILEKSLHELKIPLNVVKHKRCSWVIVISVIVVIKIKFRMTMMLKLHKELLSRKKTWNLCSSLHSLGVE